jgi:hypothetical protein
LAGDSLATMMGNLAIQADVDVICPQCGHSHVTPTTIQGLPMPSTTFSYAQKVFPFLNDYGVGTYGIGLLTGKTTYFAMRELEQEIQRKSINQRPSDVEKVADVIGDYFLKLLQEDAKNNGVDINQQPDEWRPLGFQIGGYKDKKATTVEVQIGKDVRKAVHNTSGVTVTGQTDVAMAFFQRYQQNPQDQPAYEVFSLQDAISYADFLINTTATHQKFSRMTATVGGEIDVALITPFDHFKWIKQKSLQSLIGGNNEKK